jgi:hypothetical protein
MDILQVLDTKFLYNTSKQVSSFSLQDAVAGGGALFVLVDLFRHFLKGEALMNLDK